MNCTFIQIPATRRQFVLPKVGRELLFQEINKRATKKAATGVSYNAGEVTSLKAFLT